MPTRRRSPKRKACPGSGKPVYGSGEIDGLDLWACARCHRYVRRKQDGNAYSHYAKAPTTRSDPNHAKRVMDAYGITGDEYEAILEAQGGVCFICQKPPRSKRLAVDHDHTLGDGVREAVRGLLCRRCNHRLLGSAHDATEILKRAIQYLDNPPARKVLGT